MEKLIITAAICGAEVTKEQNPAVPYTVEEIVREAKSAVDAGAAIVHLHVREDDGTPTQSKARFKTCIDAIYEVCPDVILIPSTGGAVGMTAEERLQPTELFPELWRTSLFYLQSNLKIRTIDYGSKNDTLPFVAYECTNQCFYPPARGC